jgi:uncharacterized DUF497 family protein
VKITYDPNKRDWTLQVRGLDFEHAPEIFAGEQFERQSDARDYGEPRFVTAGYLCRRMVVCGLDASRRRAANHLDEVCTCERRKALERRRRAPTMTRRN